MLPWGMTDDKRRVCEEAYPVFDDKLSKDDFLSRMSALGRKSAMCFVRACRVFQQSQKCVGCDQNVAMMLLCTTVEAMNPKAKQVTFKNWLVRNRVASLEMKNAADLKKAMNEAYDEFLKVPDREGTYHGFRRFLLDNCPQPLRQGPIEIYRKCRPPSENASFDEALSYIYHMFRSLYVHEALGRLPTRVDLEELQDAVLIGMSLLDVHQGDAYSVELTKVAEWFSKVVKESLYCYLTQEGERQGIREHMHQ